MWDLNNVTPIRPVEYTDDWTTGEDRFREAARAVGLDTSAMKYAADDKIRRCPEDGRSRHDDAGWYVTHEDMGVVYGTVGNWRTNDRQSWVSRPSQHFPAGFEERRKRRDEEDRRAVEEERARNSAKASQLLAGLAPADPGHPYLQKKGVGVYGLLRAGNDLIIPMTDIGGNVVSYEVIAPTGKKRFAYGCPGVGLHVIGAPTETVVIAEGYATAASIHEATGLRAYVVFTAGNLLKLAPEIAQKEGRRVIIAADHDEVNEKTGERTGIVAADKAAALINAEVITPDREGDDWNDVAVRDPEEVKRRFARFRPMFPFQSWSVIDPRSLPKREFLYGRWYTRRFLSLISAAPGIGKSTLAMTEAIAMATGRDLLGITPPGRVRVGIYNAEDGEDDIIRRVLAICDHHRVPRGDLDGWLTVMSGRDVDLQMVRPDRGNPIAIAETASQIRRAVVDRRLDVVICDPIANMHTCEETNEVHRLLTKPLVQIAEECNAAICLVHHNKKMQGKRATPEDARGGSSLIGAVRSARALNPMTATDAANWGVDAEDFFCISRGDKNNLARSLSQDIWLRRVDVALEDESSVGVVELWTPPKVDADITREKVAEIQDAVRAAEEPPRSSSKSRDRWVGVIIADVLGIDLSAKENKSRVSRLQEMWLKNGVLVATTARDKKGNEYAGVVAGESIWKQPEEET